jgi:predicted permease
LAVVLLAGAGIMIRSFLKIYTADIGVRTANILTAALPMPEPTYARPETRLAFVERAKARLLAIPGVESVAIGNRLPTTGAPQTAYELDGSSDIGGPVDERRLPRVSPIVVGPGYFHTLAARILSGREFTDDDGIAAGNPVVIVNEKFATRHWPGGDPLGKRVRIFEGKKAGPWRTVIGVVSNIVQGDATRQTFDPLVYLPYREQPTGMWVFVQTRVPPGTLATEFRREIQALDPDLPMFGPFTLDQRLNTWNYWSRGIIAVPLLIFAAIALLLASIGIYALMAHSVNQRTPEIGIRLAIGGTARDILKLIFRQGMLPLVVGMLAGLAVSVAVNPVWRSLLVEVSPSDPVTLATACAALLVSATLGCWIPARRAMRVDPVVALRQE